MIVALAFILLSGQAAAAAAPPPAPSDASAHYYATRFCASVALNDVSPGLLRKLYVDWDAKSVSDVDAQAFRPDDMDTPGQMAAFAKPDAPKAFVEPRGGLCSLVYLTAHLPDQAVDEFKTATLTLRPGTPGAPWGHVVNKRLGGHGPIRYFLPTSDDGRFGLCAAIFEDMRLHDTSPATVVRVQSCRLNKDDTIDNG